VVDKNRGFKMASDGRLIIKESDDEEERPKPGTKRKRQAEDSGQYYTFFLVSITFLKKLATHPFPHKILVFQKKIIVFIGVFLNVVKKNFLR